MVYEFSGISLNTMLHCKHPPLSRAPGIQRGHPVCISLHLTLRDSARLTIPSRDNICPPTISASRCRVAVILTTAFSRATGVSINTFRRIGGRSGDHVSGSLGMLLGNRIL